MFFQKLRGPEYLFETWSSLLGNSVDVMYFTRTINAQTDKKFVFRQKGCPFVIEQRTVGLQVIGNATTGRGMFFLQLNHGAEIVDPHQSRFPTMPGKGYFLDILTVDVIMDEPFQQIVR